VNLAILSLQIDYRIVLHDGPFLFLSTSVHSIFLFEFRCCVLLLDQLMYMQVRLAGCRGDGRERESRAEGV